MVFKNIGLGVSFDRSGLGLEKIGGLGLATSLPTAMCLSSEKLFKECLSYY